jgi:hypothetical protein
MWLLLIIFAPNEWYMTYEEERELIRMVTENNIMLKSIVKYLSDQRTNADSENFNDFMRNIMANMISTNMEQFMFGRFNNR